MEIHKATEGLGRITALCGGGGYQLAEKWENVTCPDCLLEIERIYDTDS